MLAENSEGKESYTYSKHLSELELQDLRENYTEKQIEIMKHDEALQAAKDAHKAATKLLKNEASANIRSLRLKAIEVEEEVWRMPNHESGFMEYVNDQGEVVGTRRLKPDEKQGNVFNMRRAVGAE